MKTADRVAELATELVTLEIELDTVEAAAVSDPGNCDARHLGALRVKRDVTAEALVQARDADQRAAAESARQATESLLDAVPGRVAEAVEPIAATVVDIGNDVTRFVAAQGRAEQDLAEVRRELEGIGEHDRIRRGSGGVSVAGTAVTTDRAASLRRVALSVAPAFDSGAPGMARALRDFARIYRG